MSKYSDVHVLLVDDREDGLVALEAVLSPLGYTLHKAGSGLTALSRVLETEFAVIVLDVQMPDMDGFETAALIKSREKSRHIPILFVTAISKDPRFVYRGYEVGAVDYLFKPFDPQILRAKVEVFVDLHCKNRQLKQQAEVIRAAEAKNRLLLQTARDTIAMISPTGEILSLSEGFMPMTGFSTQSWVGKPFGQLVSGVDDEVLWGLFHSVPSGPPTLLELKMRAQDGHILEVEASSNPIWDSGQVVSFVVVLRDITQRKEAEQVRRRAFELERSNRELEQFASVCSHDLQEPLRVILNFVPLLERRYGEKFDGEGKALLSFIEKSTRRMSDLVRDLLRYSRVGSQEMESELVEANVPVQEAVQNLQVALEESGAQVIVGDLPSISGNRTQLAQLFQNLLANAIKFRGKEPLVVEVKASEQDDRVVFEVRDNGIGLEPKYATRIFDIFRRLHTQEQYPGTGVGLAICKKVVERHGGRIWVESEPGKGAAFFFSLPVAQTSLRRPTESASALSLRS